MANVTCAELASQHFAFSFEMLNQTATNMSLLCPDHRFLASSEIPMLTLEACNFFTHEGRGAKDWQKYSSGDIWNRLSMWKIPLLQLIFLVLRAPLDPKGDLLIMLHVMGDPIDSLASLLWTLGCCRATANQVRRRLVESNQRGNRKLWKGWALLRVSQDECRPHGYGIEVEPATAPLLGADNIEEVAVANGLGTQHAVLFRDRHSKSCLKEAAGALAADRRTGLLPIIVAQVIFIGSWIISLVRITTTPASEQYRPSIELHSLAFSSLFYPFVIIVYISALIGTSQSERAIPRILTRLRRNLLACSAPRPNQPQGQNQVQEQNQLAGGGRPPTDDMDFEDEVAQATPSFWDRAEAGGLYIWRTDRWRRRGEAGMSNPILQAVMANLAVTSGTFIGMWISARLPPEASLCRPLSELAIWIVWQLSFLAGLYTNTLSHGPRFWWTVVKDCVSMIVVVCDILITQWGILNRCSCYTKPFSSAIVLPITKGVPEVLERRINGEFLAVALVGLTVQLAICVTISWWYADALHVYFQRDDGTGHFDWVDFSWLRKLKWRRRRVAAPENNDNDAGIELDDMAPR